LIRSTDKEIWLRLTEENNYVNCVRGFHRLESRQGCPQARQTEKDESLDVGKNAEPTYGMEIDDGY
jgi:hypothetical protein